MVMSKRAWFPRPVRLTLLIIAVVLAIAVLMIGALPVGWLRGTVERRLSAAYGAPVHVGSITRDSLFSFTPEIAVRDVRIGQPAWAGPGDFVRLSSASARVPVLRLLAGKFEPRALHVSGLDAALIRRADGTANWSGQAAGGENDDDRGAGPRIESLVIDNSRFTLHDAKRRLDLAGTVAADDRAGLTIVASGRFDGTPARLTAHGSGLGANPAAAWPFSAELTSGALRASAKGTMAGVLDTSDMDLSVSAKGASLKNLDYLIEAGLFGTQDIDLAAKLRHRGHDWFIDRFSGSIGRSRMSGKASVLKRDGRTVIDATIEASQLDFDDLADDAGRARAAAKRARTGPRLIPDTRINLSKMGPTNGTIRFDADRLLFANESVFRSASGTLSLDHKLLRLDRLVIGMVSGRMTGSVTVDSRKGPPVLATDLRIEGASLDRMIGDPATISGPARGLVRITGRGDTVREAFGNANGRIAFVSSGGTVKKSVAFVLGQDLGGAIGQAIGGNHGRAPLSCAILAFGANNGVLVPDPLLIDTGVSNGRGTGQIDFDGERIALTIAGASKGRALLKLADPIRIVGTLSKPLISVAGIQPPGTPNSAKKPNMLKVLGRSVGLALGINKPSPQPPPPPPGRLDCRALTVRALS